MSHEQEYYDRNQLYEEVWTDPVMKVAEHYGVSGVAIAKTCKKMHIPVPGRGYWNKVASGQKLKKTPLPDYKDCPKIRKWNPSPQPAKPQATLKDGKPDYSDRLVPEAFILQDILLEKESLPGMEVKFDPDITISNQYVKETRQNLSGSKRSFNSPDYHRYNSFNDKSFEVSVGSANIKRVLAILQTLCNELTKRGYSIGEKPLSARSPRDYQYGYSRQNTQPIYAIVLDSYISFKIKESSMRYYFSDEERKHEYQDYKYVPSGMMTFEILDVPYGTFTRREWKDGQRVKVEDGIHEIIISMIKVATMMKEQNAQIAKREELNRIEEAKQRELEKQKKIEEARIENLMKESDRLVQIKQIKEYIEVISKIGKERLGADYPESDFSKWVEWAEGVLERNDPKKWDLPKFDISEKFRYLNNKY